jgi:fibronectin type 3 domain-containing protein
VYWSGSGNGNYEKLETTTSISYTDYDVTPGDRYYYKVSASNSYGEGPMSSYDYATAPGSGEASVFYPIASGE